MSDDKRESRTKGGSPETEDATDDAPEVDAEIVDEPSRGSGRPAADAGDADGPAAAGDTGDTGNDDGSGPRATAPGVSEDDDPGAGAADGAGSGDGHDTDTPDDRAQTPADKPTRRRLGAGWMVALALAVFIGGAATAPFFYGQLARLGVPLPPLASDDQSAGSASGPQGDAASGDGADAGAVADLTAQVSALQQNLADQRNRLERLNRAIESLRDASDAAADAAAEAGSIDTARFAQADALQALRERVSTLARRLEETDSGADSQARTGALEDRLAALKTQLDSVARTKPDPEALTALRDSVNGRLDTMEGELSRMAQRVARLEERSVGADAGPNLAYEVAKLQRQMDTGDSFMADVRAIEGLLPANSARRNRAADALATLKRLGEDGIITRNRMVERFAALSPQLQRATAKAQADDGGLWANLEATATSLITVRPAEPEADDDSLAADISRIERALRAGNLEAALSLVSTLPQPARDSLAGWTSQARDRLAAERAADRLYAIATGIDRGAAEQGG